MRKLLLPLLVVIMLPVMALAQAKTDTLPKGYGQRFSKLQIVDDLSFMVRSMENAHPNLYHSISKEQYSRLKDSIVAMLKDSMTRDEARPAFAKMIAAIDEGHTSFGNTPELGQEISILQRPLFPVFMQSFDGQALVVKTDYSTHPSLKAGDRITKINGHRMDSLVQVLSGYYGGLPHWRHHVVAENMIIELYRAHIRAPFHVEYLSAGQRKQVTYTGTTAAEINKAVRAQTKPKTVPFTFERLKDNIGYLNFWDMDYSYGPSFDSFLLKTFTEIKEKPVKALIVDLRENGGGDSELGYKLLEHITNKAFRMSGGVIWKVSQEYKDYINSMDSTRRSGYDHYFAKANGDFFAGTDEPKKPKENPLRYNGKVCFLISNRTFSSANMLASTIMDYKLATLIGEISGERPNDYGDVLRMKLPHTGMLFVTSSKQFVRPNGDKNDMNPVLPDIYVNQDPVTKEDEVLLRAIQWVKKGK